MTRSCGVVHNLFTLVIFILSISVESYNETVVSIDEMRESIFDAGGFVSKKIRVRISRKADMGMSVTARSKLKRRDVLCVVPLAMTLNGHFAMRNRSRLDAKALCSLDRQTSALAASLMNESKDNVVRRWFMSRNTSNLFRWPSACVDILGRGLSGSRWVDKFRERASASKEAFRRFIAFNQTLSSQVDEVRYETVLSTIVSRAFDFAHGDLPVDAFLRPLGTQTVESVRMLVPFVDLFNHDSRRASLMVDIVPWPKAKRGPKYAVRVRTTRAVSRGKQLFLDYTRAVGRKRPEEGASASRDPHTYVAISHFLFQYGFVPTTASSEVMTTVQLPATYVREACIHGTSTGVGSVRDERLDRSPTETGTRRAHRLSDDALNARVRQIRQYLGDVDVLEITKDGLTPASLVYMRLLFMRANEAANRALWADVVTGTRHVSVENEMECLLCTQRLLASAIVSTGAGTTARGTCDEEDEEQHAPAPRRQVALCSSALASEQNILRQYSAAVNNTLERSIASGILLRDLAS